MNLPEIGEHSSTKHFRYYVYCTGKGYLHRDNVWRNSTFINNQYTGFFDTKEEAARAIINSLSDNRDEIAVLKAVYALNDKKLDKVFEMFLERKDMHGREWFYKEQSIV